MKQKILYNLSYMRKDYRIIEIDSKSYETLRLYKSGRIKELGVFKSEPLALATVALDAADKITTG